MACSFCMCAIRSFVWTQSTSLAGVSFTRAAHCADLIAPALAGTARAAPRHSPTTHTPCRLTLRIEPSSTWLSPSRLPFGNLSRRNPIVKRPVVPGPQHAGREQPAPPDRRRREAHRARTTSRVSATRASHLSLTGVLGRLASGTPDGYCMHAAGATPDGGFRIFEVWESRADFDRFAKER